MKKKILAVSLLALPYVACAADIDGSYTCLTRSERVPVETYTETLQFKTTADGSVQMTSADGKVMTGTRNGQVVSFSFNGTVGNFTFGNGSIAVDTNYLENGVAIHETSQCALGNAVPTGNGIGAYVSSEGWGAGNNNWGGYDAFRLSVTIDNVPVASSCKSNQVWVAAVTPGGQLFFYGPSGWGSAQVAGPVMDSSYGRRWVTQLFDATTTPGMGAVLRGLVGTDFYAGYGCTLDSMLNQGSYAKVYTLR